MEEDKMKITIDTYNNIVEEYIDYYKSKELNGNVQFQKEIDYLISQLNDNANILDAGTAILYKNHLILNTRHILIDIQNNFL